MIALDAAEGYAKHLALGLCHDHQVRLLSEPGGVVVEKAPAMAVRQAKRALRKGNRCPQFLQRTCTSCTGERQLASYPSTRSIKRESAACCSIARSRAEPCASKRRSKQGRTSSPSSKWTIDCRSHLSPESYTSCVSHS